MLRGVRTGANGNELKRILAAIVACGLALCIGGAATAAMQVFDVDESQSTFTAGSIDVNFTAKVNSTGVFGSQTTTGQATVMNPGYAADGTVSLDVEAGQVTLEGLDISGMVGQSGSGQMVWADILTLTIVYNIVEQALSLNAPLTMPLAGGAFSGVPNFEFTGVSDGAVTGIINYGIPAQSFGNSADLPVSGTLAEVGGNTVLSLTASELLVDLGSSPTIVTTVNDCALQVIFCVFYITTAEITVNSLVYHDVQMNLVGTAPSLGGVCGDGGLDAGEGCDDGNTVGGDGSARRCRA